MKINLKLFAIIPILAICSCTSKNPNVKDLFNNALDLGVVVPESQDAMITHENLSADKGQTDYYKFSLDKKITFDAKEYDALVITGCDTHETYENFSMVSEVKLYDASFNEMKMITAREFFATYEGEDIYETEENVGLGMHIANYDIEPGDYYFSFTPKVEVANEGYFLWVAAYIGD